MFDLEDSLKPPLLVGERVVWMGVQGGISGFVRWLGKLPQNAEDWSVGVEFDTSIGTKGMNGKLGERQLFNCRPQHGILLPIADLIKEEDFYDSPSSQNWPKKGPSSPKYASLEFFRRKRSKQASTKPSQSSKEQQSRLNSDATTVRNILLGSDWQNKKEPHDTDNIPQASFVAPRNNDVWIRQDSSQQLPYMDMEPTLADSDFSFSESDLRPNSKKRSGFSIFRWLRRSKDQNLQQRTASLDRASGKNSSASVESTTSSFAYLTVSQDYSPAVVVKNCQPNGLALCKSGVTKDLKGAQRRPVAALPRSLSIDEDYDDEDDDDSDGAPYERLRFGPAPTANHKEDSLQQNRVLSETTLNSEKLLRPYNKDGNSQQSRMLSENHLKSEEFLRRRASKSESPSSERRKRRAPVPPKPQRRRTHMRSESCPGMKSTGGFVHVPGKRPAPAPPNRKKGTCAQGGSITIARMSSPDKSPQIGSRKKYQAPLPPEDLQRMEGHAVALPTITDENEVSQGEEPIYANDSLKLEKGMLKPAKESFSASSLERENKNPLAPKLWYKRQATKKSQNRSGQVFEDDALPWLPETTPARSKVNVVALTGRSELTLLQASFLQEPGAGLSCSVATRSYEEPLYEKVDNGGERKDEKKKLRSNNLLSMLANISGLDREASELLKAHNLPKEVKLKSLETDPNRRSVQMRTSTYDNYNIKEIEDQGETHQQKSPNKLVRCHSNDNNEAMSNNLLLNDLDKELVSPSSSINKLAIELKQSVSDAESSSSPGQSGSKAKAISLFNDISSRHSSGGGPDTEVPSVVNDLHSYLCDVEKDMMTPPMKKKKAKVERNMSIDTYFKNIGSSLASSDKTGLIRRSESLANDLDVAENPKQIRSVKDEVERLNEKSDPLMAPMTSVKWEQEMRKYFKDKEHHKIQNRMPSDTENSPVSRRKGKEKSQEAEASRNDAFLDQMFGYKERQFSVKDLRREYGSNFNKEASYCGFDKGGDISCRVIKGNKINARSKNKLLKDGNRNKPDATPKFVNRSFLETSSSNAAVKSLTELPSSEPSVPTEIVSPDEKSDIDVASAMPQDASTFNVINNSKPVLPQEASKLTPRTNSQTPEESGCGSATEKAISGEVLGEGAKATTPLDLDEVRKARLRFFESIEAQKQSELDRDDSQNLGARSKIRAKKVAQVPSKQDSSRKGISVANITITATDRDVKVCKQPDEALGQENNNLRGDTKLSTPGSFLDDGRQDENVATSRRTPERYATKEEAKSDQAIAALPASVKSESAENILTCNPTPETTSSALHKPVVATSEGIMTPGGIYSVIMKKKSGELTDALPPSKELSSLNQYAEQYLKSTESLYPQVSLSGHQYPSASPRMKKTAHAPPTCSWSNPPHSSSSSPVPKPVPSISTSSRMTSPATPPPRGRSPVAKDISPVRRARSPVLDNVVAPPRTRSFASKDMPPLPRTPSSSHSNRSKDTSPQSVTKSPLPKYISPRTKHSGSTATSSSMYSSEELLSGMSEATSPELPKKNRFLVEAEEGVAKKVSQRHSAEEPLVNYQESVINYHEALKPLMNYQCSPPLPKKKSSRKLSLEGRKESAKFQESSGEHNVEMMAQSSPKGRSRAIEVMERANADYSTFPIHDFPPDLPRKKYSYSDENRPPTLPKKGSLNTGIDIMSLWQTEYFRKQQDLKDVELSDLQNSGVLLDLERSYGGQNKDLPAPSPYPRHRYTNQKSRMKQKQIRSHVEQNTKSNAPDFLNKVLPKSKASHKRDLLANKSQSLDRWRLPEPPVGDQLYNGDFELLEAKDFAEIEAFRTGAKPKSPMPFPRSSKRKDMSTDTTLGSTSKTSKDGPDQWNTLAVNKLLRQLEAAIQVGEHQRAAELAEQLAQLKVRCSVVNESKTSKPIKVNVYVEDKSASKGPIPLTVTADMKLRELKQKVEKEYGPPPHVQRWVLGHQLATNDELTLATYGVNAPDSPLFLYLVAPDKTEINATKQEHERTPKVEKINNNNPDVYQELMRNVAAATAINIKEDHNTQQRQETKNNENEQQMNVGELRIEAVNMVKNNENIAVATNNQTNEKKIQNEDVLTDGKRHSEITDKNERTLSNVGGIEVKQKDEYVAAKERTEDTQVGDEIVGQLARREDEYIIPPNRKPEEQINKDEEKEEEIYERLLVDDNEEEKVVVEEDEYVVEEDDKRGWSCATCTLVNQGGRPGCEACGDARPDNYSPVPLPGSKSPTPIVTKRPEYLDVSALSGNYRELVQLDQQEVIPSLEDFDCPICFVPTNAGEGAMLKNCLHTFCKECLTQTIEHSDDPEVQCPFRNDEYACDAPLQDREIRALVSQEAYQRLMARSMAKAESRMENTFHCKSPDCSGWCQFEDEVNIFHCPVCNKDNCLTCQAIHMGVNCRQYQEQLVVQAPDNEDARKTRNALDELVEHGDALRCPQCGVIILKKWGCDWVRCSFCKTEICWVTKGPRWGPGGKGDTSGGCKCGLKGVKCHPKCTYCH